jgi:hypothetical protein
MKTLLLCVLVSAAFTGCTHADSIDILVENITHQTPHDDRNRFPNGFWSDVRLPATATPKQLIAKLPHGDFFGALNTTNVSILKSRHVRIAYSEKEASTLDADYTAILVQTDSDREILLAQYNPANGTNASWEVRIYDAK